MEDQKGKNDYESTGERAEPSLWFLILLALTVSALGVSIITAVSVHDYVNRMCY